MARKQGFILFSAGESTCRIVRRVSAAEGDEKEALGLWERVYDQNSSAHIGFRMLMKRPDESAFSSAPSQAAMDEHEMQVNAGLFGESRTVRLNEVYRLKREKDGEPAEDEIERVRAKVIVWPLVGAARGDILRAWPVGAGL